MVTIEELLAKYDLFLLDAFGVLVHSNGALPGAANFLAKISAARKRYVIVTNDASRLPESAARRYRELGLPVEVEDVYSSGMLLGDYFERSGLRGARCLVLGTPDSEEYVRRAGGVIAPAADDGEYDAVIACDDAGYPFLGTLDTAITALFRLIDRGRRPALILPNPDVIYPRGEASFGFTAGGVALLLEEALRRRYADAPTFVRLGKPEPTLFLAALGDTSIDAALVVGDQLETDISGANAAAIDSMLVESGVSGAEARRSGTITPTWRISGLRDLTRSP